MFAQLTSLYHKVYPTFYTEPKTANSCDNKKQINEGKVKVFQNVLTKIYSSIAVVLAKLRLNSTVAVYVCGSTCSDSD